MVAHSCGGTGTRLLGEQLNYMGFSLSCLHCEAAHFVFYGKSVCLLWPALPCQSEQTPCDCGMKVIRHAGVDSRMIILDDQARQ